MPGPNVVNMALMIGGRSFGLAGAMAALAGILALPLVVVVLLELLHARFAGHPGVAGRCAALGQWPQGCSRPPGSNC